MLSLTRARLGKAATYATAACRSSQWAKPMRSSANASRAAVAGLLAAAAFLVFALVAKAQEVKVAPEEKAGYVGSETCQTCHEDLFNAFQKNPHHAVELGSRGRWKGQAC